MNKNTILAIKKTLREVHGQASDICPKRIHALKTKKQPKYKRYPKSLSEADSFNE